MHAVLLFLAAATVSVEWGYRPLPDGGLEYILQLEPNILDELVQHGQEITSEVPVSLRDVRQCRVTVGSQTLPRGGAAASQRRPHRSAQGVLVNSQTTAGGERESVVELDASAVESMRSEDLVYNVRDPRRIRLRRKAAEPPRPDMQDSPPATRPAADRPFAEPPKTISDPPKTFIEPPAYQGADAPRSPARPVSPKPVAAPQTDPPAASGRRPNNGPRTKPDIELPLPDEKSEPADAVPLQEPKPIGGKENKAPDPFPFADPPRQERPARDAEPTSNDAPPLERLKIVPNSSEKTSRGPDGDSFPNDPFGAPKARIDQEREAPKAPPHAANTPQPAGLPANPPRDAGSPREPAGKQSPADNTFLYPAPDPFPIPQERATQLMSFQSDPLDDAKKTQVEGPKPAAKSSSPSEEAPHDKRPWWALTFSLMVLFASLGGNVYLGWLNWGLRRQYASVVEMFKQQRGRNR